MSIRRRIVSLNEAARVWGVDGLEAYGRARGLAWVRADHREYERQRLASDRPDEFTAGRSWPIHRDRTGSAGRASGDYFHHDLLVAREIFARAPRRHIDVGSRIDGFVAHVASFREIEVLDVRPLASTVPGITFTQHDITALDPAYAGVADSVSCLSALEHFGLGRYGDPVDYEGWRRGLDGLTAILEPGGILYLAVPCGEPQRVEFNAHRVFSVPYLRGVLEARYDVERLAIVDQAGALSPDVDPHGQDAQRSCGLTWGSSVWVLRKR